MIKTRPKTKILSHEKEKERNYLFYLAMIWSKQVGQGKHERKREKKLREGGDG